jgi:hypothetical protein
MTNHNPRRFFITTAAALAVLGAALLPTVASADGGLKPPVPATVRYSVDEGTTFPITNAAVQRSNTGVAKGWNPAGAGASVGTDH